MLSRFRVYLHLFLNEASSHLSYQLNTFLGMASRIVFIFVQFAIWRALYGGADAVATGFGSVFIRYLITIYPKVIQLLLTVVPFAFVNFYPAHLFLDRGQAAFAPALRFGGPPVAAAPLLTGILLWNASIRRYQSTGS